MSAALLPAAIAVSVAFLVLTSITVGCLVAINRAAARAKR